MDKETSLKALLQRCFDARLTVGDLCKLAGIAPSTVSRWRKNPASIRPGTIASLESALTAYEKETP